MIHLDGSLGEGGGQILRSALGLSMVTGQPFRIERIRAGRAKPGLMRQHLMCVVAAAEICGGQTSGAELHSQDLTFEPGPIKPGDYTFALPTAGSTSLILQAIVPALLTAPAESTVTLEGGTHNPFAPPFDFLDRVFLPLLRRMGAGVDLTLHRAGFAPAGRGRMDVRVRPPTAWQPLHLDERGKVIRRRFTAVTAGLPANIAEREIATARKALRWPDDEYEHSALPDDQGPGNAVLIAIESEHVTELFSAFGQRGVRAEAVADQACREAKHYLSADVPVGEHLADQLLIPLALAGGGSYVTQPLTAHTTTNIEVIKQFLPIDVTVEQVRRLQHRITVRRK